MSSSLEVINPFNFYGNISCNGVKDVSTFEIAHQTYVAVSGKEPALYRIKPNGQLILNLRDNLGELLSSSFV